MKVALKMSEEKKEAQEDKKAPELIQEEVKATNPKRPSRSKKTVA